MHSNTQYNRNRCIGTIHTATFKVNYQVQGKF